MEIKLKENLPVYKHKVKAKTNWWMYAAVLGLLGTWLGGADIVQSSTDGSYSFKMGLSATSAIITFIWFALIFHAVKSNKLCRNKLLESIMYNREFLKFNDAGIHYGVDDTYNMTLDWNMIGYYSLNKTSLELGTPFGGIEVETNELEGFDKDEFIKLMEANKVQKY